MYIGLANFVKCNIKQIPLHFDSIIIGLNVFFKDQNRSPFCSGIAVKCAAGIRKGGSLSATPDDQSNILVWLRLVYVLAVYSKEYSDFSDTV